MMSGILKFFVPFVFLFFISKVNGVENSESDLRRFLFENYDKLVRPVRKTTDTIPVRINLNPAGLRDVDIKDRQVKFVSWLSMRWEDVYLTWDAAEYGIDRLIVPMDQIWTPDISLYTTVSDDGLFPKAQTNAIIYHNSTVLWSPIFTVKSRCLPTENQVTEDTFQCTVKLGSWTYHLGLLDVHHYIDDPLTKAMNGESFYNQHPKWILESMTASTEPKKYSCCDELYPTVSYDMRFRKRQTDS
ncbi:acetylcholine receptor subunit alpha-L1 [Parasteatoda tepidariorum]|uniref:acetylcholine receptor subunit alpha-L1 n=1 Tax=Parasteatoda tepidariorum TaxID=114398 RepID=UPI00077FB6B4|nr:acetylcholine receptor subunit alpha-L1 [Parasteatoda tepidariorum]